MNFKEILELIDKVADRGIASVEVERAGTKVRIEGKQSQPQVIHSYVTEGKHEAAGTADDRPKLGAATPHEAGATIAMVADGIQKTLKRRGHAGATSED